LRIDEHAALPSTAPAAAPIQIIGQGGITRCSRIPAMNSAATGTRGRIARVAPERRDGSLWFTAIARRTTVRQDNDVNALNKAALCRIAFKPEQLA
jgi:hypothetical protein